MCGKGSSRSTLSQNPILFVRQYRPLENRKKALEIKDIEKIFGYKAEENSQEAFSRDIWVFSYLCNGINMKDICLLRYTDITNDTIVFRRAKTIQTNRKSKSIEVINKYGTSCSGSRYMTGTVNLHIASFPDILKKQTRYQKNGQNTGIQKRRLVII